MREWRGASSLADASRRVDWSQETPIHQMVLHRPVPSAHGVGCINLVSRIVDHPEDEEKRKREQPIGNACLRQDDELVVQRTMSLVVSRSP